MGLLTVIESALLQDGCDASLRGNHTYNGRTSDCVVVTIICQICPDDRDEDIALSIVHHGTTVDIIPYYASHLDGRAEWSYHSHDPDLLDKIIQVIRRFRLAQRHFDPAWRPSDKSSDV